MHELSIAVRIVELAAARCREAGGEAVTAVTLRVGRLAAIHAASLEAAFEIAREGTLLAGATLRIIDVPVRVWCRHCNAEADLDHIVPLTCPACRRPTGDLRGGRELELESLEVCARQDVPKEIMT